ncbi:hypothetical protein Taro_032339 [Colocasia esculenta]|uniref:Uncharacterized protein n=1 Tax=Colocasia esculenta TaxID=4460 RepID=A0A843W5U9_COLES|nr:hypothetical protein [Colocasia esculenta]
MVRCSRSSSLLVLVEVRFPQNCVVLVSSCCCAALWVEVHCLAACVLLCAEGCFCIVFDSNGSVGIVFGPTLVVGHGITLFRCFVAVCSRSVGYGATFGVPGGGLGGRVVIDMPE